MGQQLTPQEALERQILMQFRRLQLEQVGVDKGDDETAQTSIVLPVP